MHIKPMYSLSCYLASLVTGILLVNAALMLLLMSLVCVVAIDVLAANFNYMYITKHMAVKDLNFQIYTSLQMNQIFVAVPIVYLV